MGVSTELIFVDSNSTDGTKEKIEAAITEYPDRKIALIPQGRGKGKGDAVRKGFEAASTQFEDQSLGADNLLDLIQTLMGGGEVKKTDDSLSGMLSGFLGGDDGKVDVGDIFTGRGNAQIRRAAPHRTGLAPHRGPADLPGLHRTVTHPRGAGQFALGQPFSKPGAG